jgi:hypothetical protein
MATNNLLNVMERQFSAWLRPTINRQAEGTTKPKGLTARGLLTATYHKCKANSKRAAYPLNTVRHSGPVSPYGLRSKFSPFHLWTGKSFHLVYPS